MSSERINYSGIPAGMLIENGQSAELQKSMAEIVKYGMSFSRGKVMDATAVSLQVAGQRPIFVDYLSYVVFGRIVRLASQCPDAKKDVCVSVKFAQELGDIINKKMTSSRKNVFKEVDFTREEGRAIIEKAFNSINVDALFTQLNEMEINNVRRMGSIIIPENPRLEQKPSEFRLE